ncbi:MAG: zinc ribbon domain-containing protein [Clostridia bacterium]|nr:zinc ribbon domain-containing protein [Clostridia bacterium]
MLCPNCGKENENSAKFCMDCGSPLEVKPPVKPPQKAEKKKKKIILPVIIFLIIGLAAVLLIGTIGIGIGAFVLWPKDNDNNNTDSTETHEYISDTDDNTEEPDITPDPQPKLTRVNYYNMYGDLLYHEVYTYYQNGLLCSMTLYKTDKYEGGNYDYAVYSDLYIYDSKGELKSKVSDSFGSKDYAGRIILEYAYDEYDNYEPVYIYPDKELSQQLPGVDTSETEEIYGDPNIITLGDSKWATDCINGIIAEGYQTDSSSCRFININDDSAPELYIDHSYGYAGAYVYTVGNGNVDSVYISHGGAYWYENQNLLLTSGGHMGNYYDVVYRIENGSFVTVASGDYGELWNEGEDFTYYYYWNNAEVDEEKYAQNLDSAFDLNKASQNDGCVFSYAQCKLLLKNIADPDISSSLDSMAAEAYAFTIKNYSWYADSLPMYALYDIDKDSVPELIVQKDGTYYFHSYKNGVCNLVGSFDLSDDTPLYGYDGNGIVILDSGRESMALSSLLRYELKDKELVFAETVADTSRDTEEKFEMTAKELGAVYDFYYANIPLNVVG